MEAFNIDFIQLLIGFLPGLILGFVIFKMTAVKPKRTIAASADNSGKLEKEVLQDEVKHLQDKVVTLEKALDMKLQ